MTKGAAHGDVVCEQDSAIVWPCRSSHDRNNTRAVTSMAAMASRASQSLKQQQSSKGTGMMVRPCEKHARNLLGASMSEITARRPPPAARLTGQALCLRPLGNGAWSTCTVHARGQVLPCALWYQTPAFSSQNSSSRPDSRVCHHLCFHVGVIQHSPAWMMGLGSCRGCPNFQNALALLSLQQTSGYT